MLVLLALMLVGGVHCSVVNLQRNSEIRVIGGFDAYPGQFPYQVSVGQVKKNGEFFHFCGGSILDSTHVVTAAHCFQKNYDKVRVKVGAHRLSDTDDPAVQTLALSNWVVHPKRTSKGDTYDVSVMTLSMSMIFNERVQPIYLPHKSADPTNRFCDLSGWGMTNPNNRTGADVLQGIHLEVISQDECFKRYPRDIDPSEICTDNYNNGGCMGDSGGPLVCHENLVPYLAGAVSWGPRHCGYPETATMYCRITSVLDFIYEQMENKDDFY